MEIVGLIFVLWVIGVLFPGSGGGRFDLGDALACTLAAIIGIAVIGALIFGMAYLAVFVAGWTGSGWAGIAAFIVLFFGALIANRQICIALERRGTHQTVQENAP